jgi:hypothetical protein
MSECTYIWNTRKGTSRPFAVRSRRAARSTPSPRSVRAASSVAMLMNV